MNDAIHTYSPSFLSNLASYYHRTAMRLHQDGRISLTAGVDPEVRQAWIACGQRTLPRPEQVMTLRDFVEGL